MSTQQYKYTLWVVGCKGEVKKILKNEKNEEIFCPLPLTFPGEFLTIREIVRGKKGLYRESVALFRHEVE